MMETPAVVKKVEVQGIDSSARLEQQETRTQFSTPAKDEDEDSEDDKEDDVPAEGAHIEEEDVDPLEDWPDETEELELIHSRLSNLERLRLVRFGQHLRKLCLRQNQISRLDPEIFGKLEKLEELDLYDNKVKNLGNALDGLNLTVLDLSFNLVRAVPEALQHFENLKIVYFVQNRISKITGLERSSSLTSLELGGNKLRVIENLDALVNLEELWLGKNKITKLQNLSALRKLKILALQSNRVTVMEGLENLESLEELYISHNGVKRIEGLEQNLRLQTLDLGNNEIPEIDNVSHLTNLEEFWINGNQIPTLQALEPQLGKLKGLQTLYLEDNPCQRADMTGYRRKIMLALPQLKQIDATFTRA